MTEIATVQRGEQPAMLNLNTRELDPYWIDPAQPLEVPVNPLHYAAHKYQLILARLDMQAARNPAQFNSGNYIQIVEKLEKLWEEINKKDGVNADTGSSDMVDTGDGAATTALGDGDAARLHPGVSADNPLTR